MSRISHFFCSLRLTVVLLAAGLLLVFLGTLAQVHEGLYVAQARYFRSWFVWNPTIGDSKWPLLLPGGYLIGSMLLLNLVAAHIKRFQFNTRKVGIHLTHGGLVLLLLGQLLTDMLSRESSMQLEEGMGKNYSEDFRATELTFINTADSAMDTVISIPEENLTRRGEIKTESLPVTVKVLAYWPNCEISQPPPASAQPVMADQGLFTNFSVLPLNSAEDGDEKAKFAVLMEVFTDKSSLGTFLVPSGMDGATEQMVRFNGTDYSLACVFAPMMGGNLLAIAKSGDMRGAGMVTFPEADLNRRGELSNATLPFKIRVKEFWPQCRLYERPGKNTLSPVITAGPGVGALVSPQALVTDTDHRNLPGTVVELIEDGKSLGTRLLWTGWNARYQSQEPIFISGKPYRLVFQFKRYYENYRLGLVKFTHDQYKGTAIPSNFASRIRILNPQKNEDRSVLIKMNSPLRYNGITYYQAGFDERRPDVTILQVVKNPSWLTPYFACVIVGLGLIYQFSIHLWAFATKRKSA